MLSIIEKIKKGRLHQFPGGVHPEGRKAISVGSEVISPDLPECLYIPVKQHSGTAGKVMVNIGDYVLKGQPLTESTNTNDLPVHAPTSGHIQAIDNHVGAHPSGLPEPTIALRPDGKEQWIDRTPIDDLSNVSPTKLIRLISEAGISGLGGAGFPTHRKLSSGKAVEFLIINGVECEPYITADDTMMRLYPEQVIRGIQILQYILQPQHTIVAIEDNKPDALSVFQAATKNSDILTVSIPTKYPAGGEKQLIQVLTGREVPSGGLSMDAGVTMFNVGTCYAIEQAIDHGKPLTERIVTITGEGVNHPQNVWALLGTPVYHLINHAEPSKKRSNQMVMGGPMMGFALKSEKTPVVKITNCILVPGEGELNTGEDARECIRCSACADACPAQLLPQQLYWHAKAQEWQKTQDYHLFDCIECGACAYVCPSEIPLVQYYRNAKQEIRSQEEEKLQAEHAKQRFEARNQRLEREKEARLEKQRLASEKRKQAMEANGSDAKDKIAAALARVKAKQQDKPASLEENSASNTSRVADAIARAKAKKLEQQTKTVAEQKDANESSQDPNKARVAAAIARAKAKKQAQAVSSDELSTDNASAIVSTIPSVSPEDEKKARVAAAIAKAKAKKQAQAASSDELSTDNASAIVSTTPSVSPEDEKKARVAAAIAKAKAKKQAQAASSDALSSDAAQSSAKTAPSRSPEDEKKARVAAAIAKAKAKKQAQAASSDESSTDNASAIVSTTSSVSSEDEKKARVAAAIAKAKAKKQGKNADNKPTQGNTQEGSE